MSRVTAELIAIVIVILLCAILLGWKMFGSGGSSIGELVASSSASVRVRVPPPAYALPP